MKKTILALTILAAALPASAQTIRRGEEKSLGCDRNSFNQGRLVTTAKCASKPSPTAVGCRSIQGRMAVFP